MVTLGVNPDLAAGAAALQRGRFEEGIARTQAGLDSVIPPGHRASALSNLCAGLTALRQYDIAIVHCSASLEADPGNWQAYNNRALAYLGKGLLRLARRDVRRGLRINPGGENLRRVEAMVEDAERRRPPGREPDPIA
jgi:tetratricopeptide (TPR) repeat protein